MVVISDEAEKPDEVEAEIFVRLSSLSPAVRAAVREDIQNTKGVTLPGVGS